jgi:phosphoglycerol geranylgeranyltransferase
MKTLAYLNNVVKTKGAGFITLLDPDRNGLKDTVAGAVKCEKGGADALFLGGSLLMNNNLDKIIEAIKKDVSIPVIIFPGDVTQVSAHADAILFMSLLSGRNPDYLVGNQVKAAPLIKEYQLEAIPTAYLLIESGKTTSVQFMSNTLPIPREKVDIIKAHALCAQYFGMQLLFLEAGSGAAEPVPVEVVSALKGYCQLPLIIGGGIRTAAAARERVTAGASFIVVGTALEKNRDAAFLQEFADAIHSA